VFVAMFLSVGQVPLGIMEGWLHAVARVNPMTNLLRMARQGFVAEITWAHTWPGLVVILVGTAIFGALAYTGLRKLNQ
jgi:ABC-type polysaccharide/polyol phosphate export permease